MKTNHRILFPVFVAALVAALNLTLTPAARAGITVVSYWRMGESDPSATAGTAATNTTDSFGSHNLKISGQAFYSNDVASAALAHVSSSLSLNFTNGGFASNSIVSTVTDNFGIEAWVKPGSTVGGQVIAYNGGTGGAGGSSGWGIIIAADGTYEGLFGGVDAFGNGIATSNVWTHVALVRGGGMSTVYTNGIAAGTSFATPIFPSGNFAVAAPPQSPFSQFFTGLVDEVRVFTFAPGQFSTSELLVNHRHALNTTNLLEGPAAGTDGAVLTVTPAINPWTATANDAWLHLATTNGVTGTNILFSFDANPGITRTGTISLAEQTLTITQAGATYVAAAPVSLVSTGLYNPTGVALDSAGNVYIADSLNFAIKKWSVANHAVTTLASLGANHVPYDVAVDGADNVYMTVQNYVTVIKWTAANGTLTTVVSQPQISGASGVAVDGAGNVYIADGSSAVQEWKVTDGSVTNLVTGLNTPRGVAVDGTGNVYIADTVNSAIKEWTAASNTVSTLISSGLNHPTGVAVDRAGNIFIADYANHAVEEWAVASGTLNTLVPSGLYYPEGAAVDSAGNVFIADTGNGAVKELAHAFVDAAVKTENAAAGTDVLGTVLPATENMSGPFTPTSDQPWLTIGTVANGVVSFSFAANTGASRTAHITLFGVSITVNQASMVTPPILTAARMLSNGAFQFSFTNNPGGSFTVITTTNISLPLSQWIVAGVPTNVAPGVFQFTAGMATNGPRRFYSVRSP